MTTEPTETPAPAPAQEPTPTPEPPKPSETDWKAEAKKWEARAKENKTAADQLAAIEEANKTEAQKTADKLAAAEKDAADARREALKFKIAAQFSIGDEDADLFLTGTDEETLTKQAERLAQRTSDRKKNGNHVPREGTSTPAVEDEMRAFTRDLFSRAD